MKLKRIVQGIALRFVTHLPLPNRMRVTLTRLGGVKVFGNSVFIGEGVIFDSLYPERIKIENHVHITMRCIILTHNLNTKSNDHMWNKGEVTFCEGCFVGANTIVCNTVRIGKNSVVGANSVVTKDIPDNEIWAGNPAKFIKKKIPYKWQKP